MSVATFEILATPGVASPMSRRQTPARSQRQRINARYDAAQTTDDNAAHWRWADSMSARAAHNPQVRRTLVSRSRYEVGNNCFLGGMVDTLADYVVGTGPTLNLLTENADYNKAVVEKFYEHCVAIKFAAKLHLMRFAKAQDGESFGVRFTNGGLKTRVKLDMRVIETEMVASPMAGLPTATADDGIIFDDWGNVIGYRILKQHPGDAIGTLEGSDSQVEHAQNVAHLFRPRRAGQTRGIPETTPALPLMPILRRWTLASLYAAETAAKISGLVTSKGTANVSPEVDEMDIIDLPYNQLLTMPEGWGLEQLRAEQPTASHEQYKRAIITETARALGMTYAYAAGDFAQHNFASGKLDFGPVGKVVLRDQDEMEDIVVEPYFVDWFAEASRIPGYLPPAPVPGLPPHGWLWDGQENIDPREAGSRDIGLRNGSESLPRLFSRRGLDVNQEHAATAKALGMTLDDYRAAIRNNLFSRPANTVVPGQDPMHGEPGNG